MAVCETEKIYQTALQYDKLGFSVIPVDHGTKKPSVMWNIFQERKPTQDELKQWFNNGHSANIGIICGPVSGNLAVLDFDDEEASKRFLTEGFSKLQKDTTVVKTSRGYHVYLRSQEPVRSFNVPELKLNVLGVGHFVMAPPSMHPSGIAYQFVSELKQPQVIEHLEESIRKRCEALGVKAPTAATVSVADKITVKPWRRLPLEFQLYFNPVKKGEREEHAFKIACLLMNEMRFPGEIALEWLKVWNEENQPPLELPELRHAIDTAKNGYIFGKESLQPDLSKTKLTVQLLTRLRDSAFTPTPPKGEEYGSDLELFNTLVAFLKKYVELVHEIYYTIAALFALATWRVEYANTATYLNVLAPHASGKTTLLKVLAWITKNSIHSEGATRGAIIRACDSKNATLLLDETDNWLDPRDFDNPLAGVLNAGYQRRVVGGVLLCEFNSETRKYETRVLDSFGFKIIAGRNPLNEVLQSRCIGIRIRKTSRIFPKLDINEAWQLRAKLLRYAELHDESLEHQSVNAIDDPRLRETFEPLLACAASDQVRTEVIKFALEEQARLTETERTGDEAEIAREVIKLSNMPEPSPLDWTAQLSVRLVTSSLNEPITNPNEQYNVRTVGKILKRLGFESKHTKTGNMIEIKPDLVNYLKRRYGERQ